MQNIDLSIWNLLRRLSFPSSVNLQSLHPNCKSVIFPLLPNVIDTMFRFRLQPHYVSRNIAQAWTSKQVHLKPINPLNVISGIWQFLREFISCLINSQEDVELLDKTPSLQEWQRAKKMPQCSPQTDFISIK